MVRAFRSALGPPHALRKYLKTLIDQIIPEFFGFIQKALGFRTDIITAFFCKLLEQFFLPCTEVFRCFHREFYIHVPAALLAQHAHAFTAQAHPPPRQWLEFQLRRQGPPRSWAQERGKTSLALRAQKYHEV